MTKPNVVSEAPPGVARNAGVEGVGRRRRTSKRRSRARERKCLATGPAPATGEGVRGTCATSPGAIRRPEVRCSLPSGQPACSCAQKLLPSGQLCLFLTQCKAEYKTHVRLESGDESYSRGAGASPSGSALQGCRTAFPGIAVRPPFDAIISIRRARASGGICSPERGRWQPSAHSDNRERSPSRDDAVCR